jgi:hypothetical protein
VSHPIPLHTAERLERAFEASSRFVAARGPKGWVMRIVAYFACQYARAVIELLEGLLAEYRAGTLVLPGMVDDSSAMPPDHETGEPRTAASRSRGPALRRAPDSGRDSGAPGGTPGIAPADVPYGAPAAETEQTAARHVAPTSRGIAIALSAPRLPAHRRDPRRAASLAIPQPSRDGPLPYWKAARHRPCTSISLLVRIITIEPEPRRLARPRPSV